MNNKYTITVEHPLVRPGLKIETEASENYLVPVVQKLMDAVRAINASSVNAAGVQASAPTEREQTLAGLLKRCARCLPPGHATRKLATDYLKQQGFFNVLRNASGVALPRLTEPEREALKNLHDHLDSLTAVCEDRNRQKAERHYQDGALNIQAHYAREMLNSIEGECVRKLFRTPGVKGPEHG